MGLVLVNAIRYNHIRSNNVDLAQMIRDELGEDMAVARSQPGFDTETTGLIHLDIPSFMTFTPKAKELFEACVHEADAVNFFILPDQWIRITYAIKDYWEPDAPTYKTEVTKLKRE